LNTAAAGGDLDKCRRLHAAHGYSCEPLSAALVWAAANNHLSVCQWIYDTSACAGGSTP